MNAYLKFKLEVDRVLDEIDLMYYALDDKSIYGSTTIKEFLEGNEEIITMLRTAFDNLREAKGDRFVRDIDYQGKFRN